MSDDDLIELDQAALDAIRAAAWDEGHRAALDGVFPLRPEDNPYRVGR